MKIWIYLSITIFTCFLSYGNAVTVSLNVPGITFTARQPIQAVVVDPNGTPIQQTVYYNPSIGGVDLNASWAGPNASVYFPQFQTGYLWYNGFWVDHAGYYVNGGNRIYVGSHWNDHWNGYWNHHWHEGWHGNEHEGWHHHPEYSVHAHEHWHHH